MHKIELYYIHAIVQNDVFFFFFFLDKWGFMVIK